MNFHLALYYVNYSQCFNDDDYQFWKEDYQLDDIITNTRIKTWHKTVVPHLNIVPSKESLELAGLRFLYVFRIIVQAIDLKIKSGNIYEYGWDKCSTSGQPIPNWDTKENMEKAIQL